MLRAILCNNCHIFNSKRNIINEQNFSKYNSNQSKIRVKFIPVFAKFPDFEGFPQHPLLNRIGLGSRGLGRGRTSLNILIGGWSILLYPQKSYIPINLDQIQNFLRQGVLPPCNPPKTEYYVRKNLIWKGTEIMHLWFPKTRFPRGAGNDCLNLNFRQNFP